MQIRGFVEIALYALRSAQLAATEHPWSHPSAAPLTVGRDEVEREIAAVRSIPVTSRPDFNQLKRSLQSAADVTAKTLEAVTSSGTFGHNLSVAVRWSSWAAEQAQVYKGGVEVPTDGMAQLNHSGEACMMKSHSRSEFFNPLHHDGPEVIFD
eukprot:6029942-Pyramimonas_sp.AAC.1